jgi:5-methyltetrahydrofolate--homocysteine methyltransferase
VGERLNPSGRKKVKQQLKKSDYTIYGAEAKVQEDAGAEALDVNAFIIERDEQETLQRAVYEVVKNSRLPVFVDTQHFEAARRVLSSYPGIGVYNSIPAREKELMKWLPMVKKYGFKAVISLVGTSIPKNQKQRMLHVKRALAIAKKVGFSRDDLIFDPLVFSVATEQEQIDYTLDTIRALYRRGMKTILGISNVSFGLPERSSLNAAFAVAAIKNGVTFLIVNPLDDSVMTVIKAARLLFTKEQPAITLSQRKKAQRVFSETDLKQAIIFGDDVASVACARRLIDSGTSAQELIDEYISKALKRVGEYYEKGTFFVPDLLKAAEASKAVLAIVKKILPQTQKKDTVVLATVKGDIHDIGKNIAGMLFESAGYEVIDLGKDVAQEKIIRAVQSHRPLALGLSALLTTTMPEMADVVATLTQKKLNVKVIIGGPNVSSDFARKIGAYGAATSAVEGLRLLEKIKR